MFKLARVLRTQVKEWLIPTSVIWGASILDLVVTLERGSLMRESNPLVHLVSDYLSLSFFYSMLLVILGTTTIGTIGLIIMWKNKLDMFAFTFAIGLSVGHIIGAMSWFADPLFMIRASAILCLIIGLLMDLLGMEIQMEEKG